MRLADFYTASALGVGNDETWKNLRAGVAPGMREISGDIPGRSIWFGSVPDVSPDGAAEPPAYDMRACRLLDLAADALASSVRRAVAAFGPARIGVVLGASNTGVDEAERLVDGWLDSGTCPAAMDLGLLELGTPARYLRERLGLEGPAYAVSTACSSATKAFGAAKRLLERGVCEAVVTGGVDGRCRFAMNGFHALGALSAGRCRPLAPDRDGITLGEGVALFLLVRDDGGEGGASVRLLGVGESSDAHHATAPDPEGRGAEAAMRAALAEARLAPEAVDYVNLHGTGTQANDAMEMKALRRIWTGKMPAYESTKGLTGHCLGAAGAVEAALCALRIAAGASRVTLSNSFAFGGSNASVILSA